MATTAIGDSNPTMKDVAKLLGPDGRILNIVEQLSKRTPELEDATVMEGNLITGHRIALRNALPSPTWRMANQGIPGSKSLAQTLDEACGQLAGRSVVDPDVANLGGNAAAYRAKEDASFLAAMSYEVATGIWYHSRATNPEKFHGLSARLSALSGVSYAGQVINSQIASTDSDQASAWWVCWGDGGVYLIYPKGSKAGLEQKDMGEQMVSDSNGNRYPAFETVWKWHIGLCVEDYRQLSRVANIDTSAVAETGTLLLQDLLKGYHQIANPMMGRCTLYVNRRLAFYLHSQAIFGMVSSTLKYEDIGNGRKILTFMGCPVRTTDSLLNTEDILA